MIFYSQDPVFWSIGELVTSQIDPQRFNSYAYASSDPINNIDPDGRQTMSLQSYSYMQQFNFWNGINSGVNSIYQSAKSFASNTAKFAASFAPGYGDGTAVVEAYTGKDFYTQEPISTTQRVIAGFSAIPLIGAIGDAGRAGSKIARVAGKVEDVASISKKYNWGRAASLGQHAIDHAADFGLKANDLEGYAKASENWIKNAKRDKDVINYIDTRGYTNYFNTKTKFTGAVDANGKVATVFKATDNFKGDGLTALEAWNRNRSQFEMRGGGR